MPIFHLSDEHIFPPPELADESGLLAVGGDLCEERLLLAYSRGIFPWYSGHDPILWWSPDPRLVLFPDELRVSRSLKQTINKEIFRVTMDRAFESVIKACATIHRKENGETWITGDMIDAYTGLHKSGYAHSVESWYKGELVGGLYGISLGSAFFGESMFARKSNASKVAFVHLVQQLSRWHFTLIDCQITTAHLTSFGAREISRDEFNKKLSAALKDIGKKKQWKTDI
ncbi:MAG: leucyl/phenylalanyl-tRNA--protein transferase [Nitrospiraceae bacterium]|nr:MAG: leucyl/phenylalanyl-tRNA--protein transferase [Nitrospiraceae bacterium]